MNPTVQPSHVPPVRRTLACLTLLALAGCGGGADDPAANAAPQAEAGQRAQVLAVRAPAVGTLSLASSNAAGKVRSGFLCELSADGSMVAFGSDSTGLISGDTNSAADVFVKNLRTGAVVRVSTTSSGAQMHGAVCRAMTPDARFVLLSDGTALYVKNLATQALTLVTPPPGVVANNQGFIGGAISDDGTKVAFITVPTQTYIGQYEYTNNVPARVMVRDLASGTLTTLATDDGVVAHGEVLSFELAISPDGKKVMFESSSAALVANDANGQADMFVRDLATGSTSLVSSDSQGTPAAAVVCCFSSYYQPRFVSNTKVSFIQAQPSSLGDRGTLTKDLANGATQLLLTSVEGDNVMLSADGSRLAFTRSYSGFDRRAYVRNVATGQEQVVSATAAGVQSNGNVVSVLLSRDLSAVAFGSNATNLLSPALAAPTPQVYVKTIAVASAP